jgi:hypothetical protein
MIIKMLRFFVRSLVSLWLVSSLKSYCDKLHTDDTTQACVLSVETVDDVISMKMKRGKAAGCDNLTLACHV